MKYVFDTGPFIDCRYYFPNVFKTYWSKFNTLAEQRAIISVKEVYNEIMKGSDIISNWAELNKNIFEKPLSDEFTVVSEILAKHRETFKKYSFYRGITSG